MAVEQDHLRRHSLRLGRALLEYSLQLIGSEIVEVAGFAKRGYWAPQVRWKGDTNEDEGFAVVRFKNGAYLTLLITSLESNPRRGFVEITGTKGSYLMDWQQNELTQRDGNTTSVTRIRNPQGEGWQFYQNVADHLTGRRSSSSPPNGRAGRSTSSTSPSKALASARG